MMTTKKLFIIVVYTLYQRLAFLLYEETRSRALAFAWRECKRSGYHVQRVESHDVTLEDDSFRRIENIFE